jgi:diketogulonate reductase-like aldo/keto reductase
MEQIHDSGRVRAIGVSNVTLEQLQELCGGARIGPRFVQNRCYASTGWDREVRHFCSASGIVYQGFSLLTANQPALARSQIAAIASRHGKTVPQVVFRFAIEVGMLPLTGTSNAAHMQDDLEATGFRLKADEVAWIERIEQR